MLFSRVVSFLAFSLTLDAFTLANTADIEATFTTLKSSTDTILPEIREAASGAVTDATITPLINQLVVVLNTANSSLAALEPASSSLVKRQSVTDIASLVLTDIVNALASLQATMPAAMLQPHIAAVDTALASPLSLLGGLLGGVVDLVGTLFTGLSLLIDLLGLVLTLL